MERKLKIFGKKFDNVRFCVRPLCEQRERHHPHLELMSISLLHCTAFFQGEDKSIERGYNHYKSGHVESFSYADGEMVLSKPVAGSVTSHTRRVVFHIVFSLKPLTELFHNKGQNLDMKNYHLNPQTTYL